MERSGNEEHAAPIEITTLGGLDIRTEGRELPGFSAQPVRMALLVHLAVEGETTRDAVIALLWPESDDRRGRHALSQTLFALRQALGEGWIHARGQLLRVTDAVTLDATRLERALEEADYERAVALYRGPFLDGWHLRASPEFQQWVDRRREHFAALNREACRGCAAAAVAEGDLAKGVAIAREWVAREPLDPEAQHLLLTLLLERGDPQSALRQYRAYERRLRDEELEPLPETRRLLEWIQLQIRAEAAPAPVAPPAGRTEPRIAVLPFRHHGREEDRYFTEGFTDELTNALARIGGLAVTARTSTIQCDPAGVELARIGEELGLDHVVRGSVRWDSSSTRPTVRISAALVRVADEVQLWGETVDVRFPSGFDVAPDVAERVARALGLPRGAAGERSPTPWMSGDQEAYELFLKAFQYANHRNQEGLETAALLYQQAIALRPDFARAYAGLAQLYAVVPGFTGSQPREWLPKAKRAAERALSLDVDLAEAHAAAAFVALHLDWDLPTAERHLNRCLELAPSYAPAWVRLGYVLCATGRSGAARRAAERGLALDPLSVATNFDTGYQYWQLRDRVAALRQFRRVQQLDPGFGPAHFFIGADSFQRGRTDEARREWSRIEHAGPLFQDVVARLDQPHDAIEALDRMTELAPGPVHFLMVSALYALLGDHARALHWLEGHAANVRGESGHLETGR
ncbi:MAG: BTAD domain-containing putative transcriptional regulator, partial [Gemmatimonadota bacterium]